MVERTGIRASDTERDVVIESLRENHASGRLTIDEFADRMEVALTAPTRAELAHLTEDLPRAIALPDPSTPRKSVRWTLAFLAWHARKGRWRPADRTGAVAFLGACRLDLRDADLSGGDVDILAVSFLGSVEVIVRLGVAVDMSGVAILGGHSQHRRTSRPAPGAPVVRIRAFSFLGAVVARARRPRG